MVFAIYLVQTVQVARTNKQKRRNFHNNTISMAFFVESFRWKYIGSVRQRRLFYKVFVIPASRLMLSNAMADLNGKKFNTNIEC